METRILLPLYAMVAMATGHGRLRNPPGRSSMWRVPDVCIISDRDARNWRDNELNCGGRYHQWSINDGKCGVCGDPWEQNPQDNQPGGRFYREVLSRCVDKTQTSAIDTWVEITANHKGYMEFKLCEHNDFRSPVNQSCLDTHVLEIVYKGVLQKDKRLFVKPSMKNIKLQLKIPHGLTCNQCVLQWTYVTGNNWGCKFDKYTKEYRCDPNGLKGPEVFVNCADIAIVDGGAGCDSIGAPFGEGVEGQYCYNPANSGNITLDDTLAIERAKTTISKQSKPTQNSEKSPPSGKKSPQSQNPKRLNSTKRTNNPQTQTTTQRKSPNKTSNNGSKKSAAQVSDVSSTKSPSKSANNQAPAQPYSAGSPPNADASAGRWTCRGAGHFRSVPGMAKWCGWNCLKDGVFEPQDTCTDVHCYCEFSQ